MDGNDLLGSHHHLLVNQIGPKSTIVSYRLAMTSPISYDFWFDVLAEHSRQKGVWRLFQEPGLNDRET